MRVRLTLAVIVLLGLAVVPAGAFAQLQVPAAGQTALQTGTQAPQSFDLFPIVPCGTRGTQPCTACGFLDILENVVKFITFGVTGPIAAALFIYSGILFLFYGANVNMASLAKRTLTNTIYGVAIILLAWIIVVQLIKTIAPGSQADRWYEFNCPAFLQGTGQRPDEPAPAPAGEAVAQIPPASELFDCTSVSDIAAVTGASTNVTAESPELVQARQCLLADPVIARITDREQLYSYERPASDKPFKELCQVFRGNTNLKEDSCPMIPHCSHATESCHYGGKYGRNGAEAVDFNITTVPAPDEPPGPNGEPPACPKGRYCGTRPDGSAYAIAPGDERALNLEIRRVWNKGQGCPTIKFLLFHTQEAPHTHISTTACDKDGAGIAEAR